MRVTLSGFAMGATIAGAALLVSACGSKNATPVNVTDTNYTESDMTNTVSDDMTGIDATNGADAAMAGDVATGNDSGAPVRKKR